MPTTIFVNSAVAYIATKAAVAAVTVHDVVPTTTNPS